VLISSGTTCHGYENIYVNNKESSITLQKYKPRLQLREGNISYGPKILLGILLLLS
jgi:hypothetical protein